MKIIDTFKDKQFYMDLHTNVCPLIKSVIYDNFNFGDSSNKKYLISWFNPEKLYKNVLPQPYKGDLSFRQSKKFNLQLHYPTYIFLHVVNALYNNRKDILIEDVCCGIGRTEVYLKYLGFTNFHLIDNFSQITKNDMLIFLKGANLKYKINQDNLNPIISYISAYPSFPKPINDSIELFCHYTNPSMINVLTPTLKNRGFVLLCRDIDNLMLAWCKKEKQKEFEKKLKPWIIENV